VLSGEWWPNDEWVEEVLDWHDWERWKKERVEVEREDWVVLLGRGLGGLEHDLGKVSRCTAVHKIQFGPVT
jgi:hypothetical protein